MSSPFANANYGYSTNQPVPPPAQNNLNEQQTHQMTTNYNQDISNKHPQVQTIMSRDNISQIFNNNVVHYTVARDTNPSYVRCCHYCSRDIETKVDLRYPDLTLSQQFFVKEEAQCNEKNCGYCSTFIMTKTQVHVGNDSTGPVLLKFEKYVGGFRNARYGYLLFMSLSMSD